MMEKSLYFAYGSNINLDQMQYRCPDASVYGQAVLDNYDLRFRGSGVATVEPKEGACVYGLLWELTDKCEASLDRYEGYPRLYFKQTLEVRTFDGQRVPVMAYIMNPELHLKPSLPPRDYYLGIKTGYEQNGLPPVEDPSLFPKVPDPFAEVNSGKKGKQGQKIVKRILEIAAGKVLPQQNNISGLGVGKNLPPAIIGIGVLKSACDGQRNPQHKGFGHLGCPARHKKFPLSFFVLL